jgi:hypothetical protein
MTVLGDWPVRAAAPVGDAVELFYDNVFREEQIGDINRRAVVGRKSHAARELWPSGT